MEDQPGPKQHIKTKQTLKVDQTCLSIGEQLEQILNKMLNAFESRFR